MRVLVVVAMVVAGIALAPGPAAAGTGTALLPYVAADAEVVAVIDVADARDRPLFQQGAQAILDRAGDLHAMLALAGIDALADVDTLLIAGRYGPAGNLYDLNQDLLLIVEGGFTRKQVAALMVGATRKAHRGQAYWVSGGSELALIGKRLFATSAGGMAPTIDRVKRKARGLTRSSRAALLRGVVAGTDTRHDAWMVGVMPASSATAMRSMGFDAEAFSVGVTLETDLVVEVRIRAIDDATAAAMATMLASQLDQLRQVAGQFGLGALGASLGVQQDRQVIDLDATVSESEVATLVSLISTL